VFLLRLIRRSAPLNQRFFLTTQHASSQLDPPQTEDGNKVPVSHGTGEKMKVIAKTPFVHLGGLLAFIYVGIEFTIGSWAVTYIVEVRGGGDDSGYVSSGFFGGLMVGRVLHVLVSWVISEQNAVLVYMVVALGLQVVSRAALNRDATLILGKLFSSSGKSTAYSATP
jgi:fucose permease